MGSCGCRTGPLGEVAAFSTIFPSHAALASIVWANDHRFFIRGLVARRLTGVDPTRRNGGRSEIPFTVGAVPWTRGLHLEAPHGPRDRSRSRPEESFSVTNSLADLSRIHVRTAPRQMGAPRVPFAHAPCRF